MNYDAILNMYYAEKRVLADGIFIFSFPEFVCWFVTRFFFCSRAFPANCIRMSERLVNKISDDNDCRREERDEQILNNNNNDVFSRSRVDRSFVVSKHWNEHNTI